MRSPLVDLIVDGVLGSGLNGDPQGLTPSLIYGINRSGTQIPGLETRLDSIYFTVTTLSTVGFGDIAAHSQGARAVVTVQKPSACFSMSTFGPLQKFNRTFAASGAFTRTSTLPAPSTRGYSAPQTFVAAGRKSPGS